MGRDWPVMSVIRTSSTPVTGHNEFQMIVCPAIVGGGKWFFPDGVRLDLELLEERRFDSGVVILRYGVRGAAGGLALGMKSSEILQA